MFLLRKESAALHLPTAARQVYDVTGAGDTVIATLAVALGGGLEWEASVRLANAAAGLAVANVGTAAGGREELLHHLSAATPVHQIVPCDDYEALATALGSFDLSDTVRWFGEGWYAHSKGTNIAAQPLYNTALAGPGTSPNGNLVLSLDNPYLNDADRATIRDNLAAYGLLGGIPIDADGDGNPDFTTAPDSFLMARANTDLTTGRADTTVELYRFVTGFDDELGVGDRGQVHAADLGQHADHGFIGAAMRRSPQGCDAGGDTGIGIGAG